MTANKNSLDVLVHVALTEEAEAFHSKNFYVLGKEQREEIFSYYKFDFFGKRGDKRTGILLPVGEIGDRSRDAVLLFCKKFNPSVVVNIGISGRLGNDARVGDVIVPTQLNIYDFRSAIRDSVSGGYELVLGGQPVVTDRIALNTCTSIEFRKKVSLFTLEQFLSENFLNINADENKIVNQWVSENVLADPPQVVPGPFAVGSAVGKSEAFKKELMKTNRNVLAIDMESALVGDALSSLAKKPRFFSIRSISDPGDERKSACDGIANGVIRRWAMYNAIKVTKEILESTAFFSGEYEDDGQSLTGFPIISHYQFDYPGQNYIENNNTNFLNERYINLYSVHPNMVETPSSFTEFLDFITKITPESRVLVRGHGGCGKSALLMISKSIMNQISPDTSTIFLNLRTLRFAIDGRDIYQFIRSEIEAQIRSNSGVTQSLIIVFLDEIYGASGEDEIIHIIEQSIGKKKCCFVFAFGEDHYYLLQKNDPKILNPAVTQYEYEREFILKGISSVDSASALALIRGLLKTSSSASNVTAEHVYQGVMDLKFPYINHFVISIYLANFRKFGFRNLRNSTQFILQAMQSLCDKLSEIRGIEVSLADISIEALRFNVSQLYKTSDKDFFQRSSCKLYNEIFSVFPRVVQTTLIANGIIHLFSSYNKVDKNVFLAYKIDRDVFLSIVFAADVNCCVKDLMINENIEQTVLKAAEILYENLDAPSISYSLYLFGRAQSSSGKIWALKIFNRAKIMTLNEDEDNNKLLRLARRSLAISLSMYGDREATEEYIMSLLQDQTEDSLNRAFHLEYYGDSGAQDVAVPLNLEDKGGSWKRTRQMLGGRIRNALNSRVCDEYTKICIATYFQFIRYRHQAGSLTERDRDTSIGLLNDIISAPFALEFQLNAFLSMLLEKLRIPSFSEIDAIKEFYKLKFVPRIGWTSRKVAVHGDDIEYVASHTWGALLLADLLTGFIFPTVSDDIRRRTSQMLLIHDLGEAYIGDYVPTDAVAKEKEQVVLSKMATMATYSGLKRLTEWQLLWAEFESGYTKAARLAKDFDKLDAIFQASIYATRFPEQDSLKEFLNDNLRQIQTKELREIGRRVIQTSIN